MTRWSLRRRFGVTQDTERQYQPEAAEQEAAATGKPGTHQYGAAVHGQHPGQAAAHSQPGGVAVLAPAQTSAWQASATAATAAAAATPAAVRDAQAEPGQVAEPAVRQSFWPDICDQFGLHLLVLAEQLRASLDELEADEGDPERLRRLFQVDHAVTRMRRASRDLRTLAGRSEEELAGFTTSLLDIIRMAASAIERYTQVTVGRVTDLAVLGYAADDVGSLMAALLDNATRYSPGAVTVSCHLLDEGGVMFRVEDAGIGMGPEQVNTLNATLAGPVPDVDERTGRHTGFPVVHRIARKHSIGVRLAARPLPNSGTVVMVTLPPHLLCEVPPEAAPGRPASAAESAPSSASRPAAIPDLPRREPGQPPAWEPPELPDRDQQPRDQQPNDQELNDQQPNDQQPNDQEYTDQQSTEQRQPQPGTLPRRQRASLRGDEPRRTQREPAPGPTPEQQAAARRAFADELNAFSLGSAGVLNTAVDTAPEEEA